MTFSALPNISRAGYSLTLAYKKNISFFSPWSYGYMGSISGYWDLEKLPSFQNVSATEKTLYTTTVRGSLSRLRKSLGAVDYEQGFDWKVWVQGNYVADQFFPSLFSTLDVGFLLPLKNSSFWIKTAAGQGFAEGLTPSAISILAVLVLITWTLKAEGDNSTGYLGFPRPRYRPGGW